MLNAVPNITMRYNGDSKIYNRLGLWVSLVRSGVCLNPSTYL